MAKHELNRLDHRGHGPVAVWDPEDKSQILTAEEVFKKHQLEGYRMYDLNRAPVEEAILAEFDPAVTEILAVPVHKMVGG